MQMKQHHAQWQSQMEQIIMKDYYIHLVEQRQPISLNIQYQIRVHIESQHI